MVTHKHHYSIMVTRLILTLALLCVTSQAQVLLGKSKAFDVVNAGCSTKKDSNEAATTGGSEIAKSSTLRWLAQRFTASASYDACKIILPLSKTGSPTFTFNVSIYTDSPGNPGTMIGSSDSMSAADLTETETDYSFDISAPVIASGSTNWIVIQSVTTQDPLNYIWWHRSTSALADSINSSSDGSTWAEVSAARISKYKIYSQ
jgi:hypothetical protein